MNGKFKRGRLNYLVNNECNENFKKKSFPNTKMERLRAQILSQNGPLASSNPLSAPILTQMGFYHSKFELKNTTEPHPSLISPSSPLPLIQNLSGHGLMGSQSSNGYPLLLRTPKNLQKIVST